MTWRYSLKTLLASLIVVFAMLCALIWYRGNLQRIKDGHAQWAAGLMLVDYLENNNGVWPNNWSVLESQFEKIGKGQTNWQFEEFKQRVKIDFALDLAELKRTAEVESSDKFNVISTKSCSKVAPRGDGTMLVRSYLRGRSKGVSE